MNLTSEIEQKVNELVKKFGAEEKATIIFSDRPEISDFQSNIAFSLAKVLHKAPAMIASELAENLKSENFEAFAVGGFLNFKLTNKALDKILENLFSDERCGIEKVNGEKIVLDYGGPNVAKPLHVGHLRSAVIGQTLKNLSNFMGNETIGDVHLGDWGLQMGLTIAGIMDKFDCRYYFTGEGEKPALTEENLEKIYPESAQRAKVDEEFKKRAQEITVKLQAKEKGYYDIWKEIREISVKAIKKIYAQLNVNFERWYGESDADAFVEKVFEILNSKNLIEKSNGAEIVNVAKEDDNSPMPPVIVRSSAGAELYATTELATIVARENEFNPNKIVYLTDNRQSMHFNQVFRVCKLAGIGEGIDFVHIPFGTVNGADGKPFKTRDGGTMYLSDLISLIQNACKEKILQSEKVSNEEEIEELSKKIGICALKFGDLINFPAKDYVFDVDKFSSFEGKTGPYMQYCAVRIDSILSKAGNFVPTFCVETKEEKDLIISLLKFSQDVKSAYLQFAPNIFVQSAYVLATNFSALYNKTKILGEKDEKRRASLLTLLKVVRKALGIFAKLVAIEIPEKM